MHDCPDCGSVCDCDLDPLPRKQAPDDCTHNCAAAATNAARDEVLGLGYEPYDDDPDRLR